MAAAKRILIVDDDASLRKFLTTILDTLGYVVAGYADSQESARQQALSLHPDLIIMDVIMETPQAGIDAAREIGHHVQTPIIYLTTSGEETILRRALQTAPFGYLVKPIQPENLRAAIEITLLRAESESSLRAAHAALEESESLFRGIYHNMQVGYYRMDPQDRFLLVNPMFIEMLGMNPQRQFIGRSMDELGIASRHEREQLREELRQKNRLIQYGGIWRHKDGQDLHVLENVWQVHDPDGHLLYYEGTVQDITHLRALESELRHSQKLEVIGVMAGRVAHELNNRLTGVLGYADLLAMKLRDQPELMHYIESIRSNTQNSAGVIQQLLKFSKRPSSSVPETYRLDELITSRREIFSLVLSSKIELREDLDCPSAVVYGDPKQMEQILFNLIVNARDAMPEGGVLTLRISEADYIAPYSMNGVIPHGDYVRLTVSDTGTGIEPEHIDRIFEPFFTTKDEGIGSGMGLSTVRSMVEDHRGFIRVDSQPGQGSQFEILLPLVESRSN